MALDRQPSTIVRELKRNCGARLGCQPAYAQAHPDTRRRPGRLAREQAHRVISHKTIYRFVYAQLQRTNDRRWRFSLPRAKYKRGWRIKGGWSRAGGVSPLQASLDLGGASRAILSRKGRGV